MPATRSPALAPVAEASDSIRRRILNSARRHLFTDGYNALRMDDLAHELGMSKKTLYRHFPAKDAIVGIIIDEMGSALRDDLERILADPKTSFAQKLRGVVDAVSPRIELTSPSMLRELQRYAPKIYRKLDELRQKNIPSVFGRLFRTGIDEGALRPVVDPEFAAQFWLQAIRGLVHPDTLAVTHLTPGQTLEKSLELFTGGLLTTTGRKEYEKIFAR